MVVVHPPSTTAGTEAGALGCPLWLQCPVMFGLQEMHLLGFRWQAGLSFELFAVGLLPSLWK